MPLKAWSSGPGTPCHRPLVLLLSVLPRKCASPWLTHPARRAGAVLGLQGTGPGGRKLEREECQPERGPGHVEGKPRGHCCNSSVMTQEAQRRHHPCLAQSNHSFCGRWHLCHPVRICRPGSWGAGAGGGEGGRGERGGSSPPLAGWPALAFRLLPLANTISSGTDGAEKKGVCPSWADRSIPLTQCSS